LKNPLFVGGGTIFGPRPRKYDIKLNKKVTKLARKSALAYKAKEDGGIRVVKGLSMDAPKTQELLGTFGKLGLADQKTLVVVPEQNKALYLSSRNLPKHRVMTAGDLSTYDIMNCQNIVFVDNAHEVITGILTA
jgi:large subunit ribosomal protein L4